MIFMLIITFLLAASLPYLSTGYRVGASSLLLLPVVAMGLLVYGPATIIPLQAFNALLTMQAAIGPLLILVVFALCTEVTHVQAYLLTNIALGGLLLLSSNDLLLALLCIELSSYSTYLLTGSSQNEPSEAAGLKYLLLGSLASTLIYLGIALNYASGNFSFALLDPLGQMLILIGLAWKVASAPLHRWAVDVYDATPNHITGVISTLPKIALITFIIGLTIPPIADFLFISLIIGSLLIGSYGGLVESRIKPLLTYSSILNVGFLLLVGYLGSMTTSSLYVAQYFIGTTALWIILRTNIHSVLQLQGWYAQVPVLAIIMTVLVLSTAGIPPFVGFWAKFYVMFDTVLHGYYYLTLIIILVSVTSTAYYLRVFKVMVSTRPVSGSLPLVHPVVSPIALAVLLYSLQQEVFMLAL